MYYLKTVINYLGIKVTSKDRFSHIMFSRVFQRKGSVPLAQDRWLLFESWLSHTCYITLDRFLTLMYFSVLICNIWTLAGLSFRITVKIKS